MRCPLSGPYCTHGNPSQCDSLSKPPRGAGDTDESSITGIGWRFLSSPSRWSDFDDGSLDVETWTNAAISQPLLSSSSPHRYRLTGGVLGTWTNSRLHLTDAVTFTIDTLPSLSHIGGSVLTTAPSFRAVGNISSSQISYPLSNRASSHIIHLGPTQTPRAGLDPLPHEYKQNTCEFFFFSFTFSWWILGLVRGVSVPSAPHTT